MGFGLSLGGSKSSSSTAPWAPQQAFLKDLWGNAQGLFDQGVYSGDWYADPTDEQLRAIEQGYGVADRAPGIAGQFADMGSALMPALGSALDYYSGVAGGTDPLSTAQGIADFAGQFADSPYTDGMIASALRDPYRQLTEQTLPGIAMNAAATGTSGSSRRAISDAIATRGYEDRAADISAGIRQSNLDRGYDMARQVSGERAMAANNMANLGSQGMGYLGSSLDYYGMQPEMLAQWGGYDQSLRQGETDAARAKWMAPWDMLGMYSDVVQAGNWGGTTNQKGSSFGFTGSF